MFETSHETTLENLQANVPAIYLLDRIQPIYLLDRIQRYNDLIADAHTAAQYLQAQKDKEETAVRMLAQAVERLESTEEIREIWKYRKDLRKATEFTESVALGACRLLAESVHDLELHLKIMAN